MIMKSLTYENSPILVNFVASTYFVTLGPDAVGISNEKYIDTGQYKRTIINLSYYQVSYFYISKTASLPLCYNVLKLMNIFFPLPFRMRWLAERESLLHFTFDSPAYPPPPTPRALTVSALVVQKPSLPRAGTMQQGAHHMARTAPVVSPPPDKVSVLLYNVTHTDVIFAVRGKDGVTTDCLARATFSKFLALTQAVHDALETVEDKHDCGICVTSEEGMDRWVGFDLSQAPVTWDRWDDFRLRDRSEVNFSSGPVITKVFLPLMGVLMPVWLRTMHEWSTPDSRCWPRAATSPPGPPASTGTGGGASVDGGRKRKVSASPHTVAKRRSWEGRGRGDPGDGPATRVPAVTVPACSVFTTTASSPRRMPTPSTDATCYATVYFTSGSAEPRNQHHNVVDNSTEAAAKMLSIFISCFFPSVVPINVHSGPGVFRTSHNVTFVNTQLRPLIDAHRDALAHTHGGDWPAYCRVTIALTDGTPARLAAISASLRNYKPLFLHMWQLKSFWHNRSVSESDIDTQSFEDWETRPPVRVSDLSPMHATLVEAMIQYKERFERARDRGEGAHELGTFWLRKSGKPVLSVLMVLNRQEDDVASSDMGEGPYKFIHGINSEVSMPTGSLCSERNAIGQALASNPCIKRSDFLCIAVLSVDLGGRTSALNPLAPCGACTEWLAKIAEVNPAFNVIMFEDSTCTNIFVRSVLSL